MRPKLKYQVIYRHRAEYSVSVMCRFFGVSRSGYYNFVHRAGRPEKDKELADLIAWQRKRCWGTYGYRRMWMWLKRQNIHKNPKTILRIMRKYNLLSEIRRHRKWQQMGQQAHKYKNLLNRKFHADRPNRKWVTDISYIHTKQGVLYLSMIRDLYDNCIVAYKTGTEQTVNLVLDTIRLAMKQVKKKAAEELQLHSDQGAQYASQAYFELTQTYGIRDTPLTLADERIARAIRENNARLVIIDPVQAFLGADVDMNRANEVRPIFRSLGDIAQATGCAIVLIGHLNKAAGTQSTYRGLGSIDITAAVRSLLFIGKLKDSPTTRVLIHEKSSLAPPGQSLAFSLGDEKGFEWIGAYDITADELLAGTDTAKTESKTAQAQMLILELLADGKRMPSAELEKAVNERGISSRTMRTAKSRIGDRLVTEKDGTAWVCYLRD